MTANDGGKRWFCTDCGDVSLDVAMLVEPHPFQAGEIITGCPLCREANTLVSACDWPGCRQPASSGIPIGESYIHRCWAHNPRNSAFRPTPTEVSHDPS